MSWINLSILSTNNQVDNLSEFMLAHGAISVSIQDDNLNQPNEEIIFGEPRNGPEQFWQHTQINALFKNIIDAKKIAKALEEKFYMELHPNFNEIPDQDWVKLTQEQFHPISIQNKIWIVPTWHDVVDNNAINLILDPGLAFGTGSHPTTHLCIEWLLKHIKENDTVLDYGCGSGILAICASKLGANSVLGVDIDPQAIIASKQNATKNNTKINFQNSQEKINFKSDLIVANILSSALKVLAPAIAKHCNTRGKIALSGILKSQENEIKDIYKEWFDMDKSTYKDEWVCMSGVKI